jgi:hypothetical protein
LSGIITLLTIPRLDQNCIQDEEIKFKLYLEEHGFDVSKMGLPITKVEGGMKQVEIVSTNEGERRKSEGTMGGEQTGEEGHERYAAVVKAAKRGSVVFKKITAVAL